MQWTITNFKALDSGTIDLRFGACTFITGVNSGGKSSLIQSLLLATQTANHEGAITLNSSLTKLGSATDLVKYGEDTITLTITADNYDHINAVRRFPFITVTSIELNLVASQLNELELASCSLTYRDGTDTKLCHIGTPQEQNQIRKSHRSTPPLLTQLDSTLNWLTIDHLAGQRPQRLYVGFQDLSPVILAHAESTSSYEKRYFNHLVRDDSTNLTPFFLRSRTGIYAAIQDSQELADKLNLELPEDLAQYSSTNEPALARRARRRLREMQALDDVEFTKLATSLAEFRSKFPVTFARIAPYSQSAPFVSLNGNDLDETFEGRRSNILAPLAQAAALLQQLPNQVKYVGPLRDEPRVLWPYHETPSRPLPVGIRGELSAMVLHDKGDQVVTFNDIQQQGHKSTLRKAVNYWLNALGMNLSVTTTERTKLGLGIEVSDGQTARDLTAVGVGVSQVLPILVALLSSDANSIFITEQPELHLHPAMQARLADFLIFARPDVRKVVETHSEAMITRLRRRIAEESAEQSANHIVFVESSGAGSRSRQLTIDEYGNLNEWPADFLGNDWEDINAIMAANILKNHGDGSR